MGPGTQTGDPDPHSVVPPVAQGAFVGVHGAPWTQVLQTPWAEQVRPAPQGKPGG